MPTRLAFVVLLAAFALVGCGGSDNGGDTADTTTTAGETIRGPDWATPLLSKSGPEEAAVMATSDYAVGDNRVGFLLVAANGKRVESETAAVYYRPKDEGATMTATARLVRIGVRDSTGDEPSAIYATRLRFPEPGKYWIIVQPRGKPFQGFQILDVKDETVAVSVGARAPASNNPTTASRPAERITTARPPDTALLRHSIADSLERRIAFVVAFATPALCQTRTCGPTIEVLEAVRKRYERRGIRFIHVEIYEDNTPGKGVNRWVKEWKLPTEPWVFVVDRSGTVRTRFEGAVSVGELDQAVRANLLQ